MENSNTPTTTCSAKPRLIVGMHTTLYPFQAESVRKLLALMQASPTKSAYCANDTGTGKSVTAITLSLNLPSASSSTLICCPAIMRLVWRDEIYKFAKLNPTQLPTVNVVESQKDFDELMATTTASTLTGYTIITYDQLAKVTAKLSNAEKLAAAGYTFKLIICDEAHAVKANSAKRTKVLFKHVLPMCEYRLLQSATPFTKNVTDFYTACHAILPSFPYFANFYAFANRYSFARMTNYGVDYYGLKNPEELSLCIRKHFYVRYKKEDVLKELPPIQYSKVPLSEVYAVKPTPEHEQQIGRALMGLEEMLVRAKTTTEYKEDGTPTSVTRQEISTAIASIRKAQGLVKVKPSAEYITNLLEQELPVVVFAWHKDVISKLMEELHEYKPLSITGETSPQKRQDAIKSFQEGDTNLIILNIVAGGVGITLTRAENVVLVEQSYVPSDIYQAVSRCHRIGSKGQVVVHWISVLGSIDERIIDVVMQRAKEFKKVCDG